MFELSVCMIVKNEEEVLDRILGAVKKFADEIIIVDTGSTDSTIDIASKYTDLVFNFEWCDDFAKARNFSFSHASKDYIMWLDADDYISNHNIDLINNLKTTETHEVDMYFLKYILAKDEDTSTFEFFRERIIKNNQKFLWQGFVHECISPSGIVKYLDIQIEHRKVKSATRRNLDIYLKHQQDGYIFNARETYYFAREYYYNNEYNMAIVWLKKYLTMPDQYFPDLTGAHILLTTIYVSLGDILTAKKYAYEYINSHTPTAELCNILAQIYEQEGNIESSIFWYKNAINAPLQTGGFVVPDYQEFLPCINLCRLLYNTNFAESKKYHEITKRLKPNNPLVQYNDRFFAQEK